MPRQAKAQPLGKYHAELSRLLRQMSEDPRVTSGIRENISSALNGIQKLLLKARTRKPEVGVEVCLPPSPQTPKRSRR